MCEFSIIVPAHDSASSVSETLDSIVAQTFEGWEAIVVDDGSTDHTADIADEYARRDARVSVVRQENMGLSLARNAGTARALSPFVCPLDADDVYLPNFLEAQQLFISEHPGFDVYSCNVDAWMPDGSRTRFPLRPEYDGVIETGLDDLLDQNRFTAITVIRREMFERLGGFRPLLGLEDYDLWLRAAATGSRFLHNPEKLALYRQRPGSMSTDRVAMVIAQRDAVRSLLDTTSLELATRAVGLASIARLESLVARLRLDRQMDVGRYHGARRLYWAGRRTYTSSKPKMLLGLAAAAVSPRLLARLVAARNRRPS